MSDAVFRKTEKGQAEIQHRTLGLTPRQRRVLILIDGKKSVSQLRELVATDDLTHLLSNLEELGLIELVGVVDTATGSTNPVDRLDSITAFRPLPNPPNPKELEMARHFMINTLRTFSATPVDHLSLIEEIFAAPDHEALRALFGRWYRAIMETTQGRARAEELRLDLLKVL